MLSHLSMAPAVAEGPPRQSRIRAKAAPYVMTCKASLHRMSTYGWRPKPTFGETTTRCRRTTLNLAQTFGHPIVFWGGRVFGRIVKNEDQRAALLCSGCRKMHWRSARYDHRRATRTPDLLTLGSFQTGLSRLRVPSLRARVCVRRCYPSPV